MSLVEVVLNDLFDFDVGGRLSLFSIAAIWLTGRFSVLVVTRARTVQSLALTLATLALICVALLVSRTMAVLDALSTPMCMVDVTFTLTSYLFLCCRFAGPWLVYLNVLVFVCR